MNIGEFATVTRTRVKRHEDGEFVIVGKRGHLYEHSDSLLGLIFMPNKPRLWPNARRKLECAGFTIWQDGDKEGSALFDPENAAQVRLALKVVGVKRKRRASPGQLANLRKAPGRGASSVLETEIVSDVEVGVEV
jgi:hypothetical protein